MKGDFKMLRTILFLSSVLGLVRSSGVDHASPIAPIGHAPVVTAASSQYFERTFNRLVVPHAVAAPAPPVVAPAPPVIPVFSVAPPPVQPLIPIAPAPPVFVESARSVPVPVNPPPAQEPPEQPNNVAIAIATAHAAAPVATILLPPYPFGFPPNFGFIPPQPPINVPDDNSKEPTTQTTTQAEVTTTTTEPEATTPIPSNSDNSFVQALPSNENVNFNQYGPPLPPDQQPRPQFQPLPQQPRPQFQPLPQQPHPQFQPLPQQPHPQFQPLPQQPHPQFQPLPQQPHPQFQPLPQQPRPQFQPLPRPQPQPQHRPHFQPRPQQQWPQTIPKAKPQKIKTSVEVVPVPLAYIAPPPMPKHHHHHHHHHPHHAHIKVVKHVYTYVPMSSSKIILKKVRSAPAHLIAYRSVGNARAGVKEAELTTFRPFLKPNTKPPRL